MKFLIFIAVLSALIGALFFYWITKWILRRKLKKRFQRASAGEFEAKNFLESLGYTFLEVQKSSWLSMWIDEEEHTYLVRPDAFVQKGKKKFLVEIKTGKIATNPKLTATRRQLLEYYYSYNEVDGIILINADDKSLFHIRFSDPVQADFQEFTLKENVRG